jgi:UDPglucose--hexose-1-phosphate uridylyltransferase
MSEFRQDPLSGRWAIIGSERAGRPNEFVEQAMRYSSAACPFCAGNESATPPAIVQYPSSGPWKVRVIPNKYPAVAPDPAPALSQRVSDRTAGRARGHLFPFASAPGEGVHEVIVESARHVVSLTDLTPDEAALVFRSYRDRLRSLRADGRCRYVQIFKNVGPAAGASIEHAHSQLIGMPQVPETIERELQRCELAQRQSGRPLLETILEAEVATGERLVAQTSDFIAHCPWASRFAYQVSIAPRKQQASFEALEDSEMGKAARFICDIIGRMERALGRPAYNLFLYTEPFDSHRCDHYHWHIEIFPRVTKTAGFEWSTDCFINPVPPELAAETLRAAEHVD